MKLKFNKRYAPDIYGDKVHYEHLHRYMFALRFVTNKRVLDYGCGEGYGSEILAQKAKKVVGVDVDIDIIRHANYKYKNVGSNNSNLFFSTNTGHSWNYREYDVIVCFEVLEHTNDPDSLVRLFKDTLGDKGLLIISTPDKFNYSDITMHKNQEHVNELYLAEFKQILSSHFKNVITFGQRAFSGSNIWVNNGENNNHLDYNETIIARHGAYYNLAGSVGKNPEFNIAVALDNSDNLPVFMSNNWLIDSDPVFSVKAKVLDWLLRKIRL